MHTIKHALMQRCPKLDERHEPEQPITVPLWLVHTAILALSAGEELREALEEVRGSTPLLIEAAIECYDDEEKRLCAGISETHA